MNREETAKPQYRVRPSFFFHAANDEEAVMRVSYVQALLRDALNAHGLNGSPGAYTFTYEGFEFESGYLAASGWPDGEDRIVR